MDREEQGRVEEEQAQGYRRRLLIIDGQIEALREVISELRDELTQLRADTKICNQLNLLAIPKGVEEAKGPNGNKEKALPNW